MAQIATPQTTVGPSIISGRLVKLKPVLQRSAHPPERSKSSSLRACLSPRDLPTREVCYRSGGAAMNSIRLETTIDEATALALPALRPLLGKRVELIALQSGSEPAPNQTRKLTLDDLLAARVD